MVFTGEKKKWQAVKSNYYLQFNKVTALFLAMRELEKSSGVQPSAPLGLHAHFYVFWCQEICHKTDILRFRSVFALNSSAEENSCQFLLFLGGEANFNRKHFAVADNAGSTL